MLEGTRLLVPPSSRLTARPISQSYEGQASEIAPYHGVYIQMNAYLLFLPFILDSHLT
jgi:hypothetical protein